jgi:hypothetical protein
VSSITPREAAPGRRAAPDDARLALAEDVLHRIPGHRFGHRQRLARRGVDLGAHLRVDRLDVDAERAQPLALALERVARRPVLEHLGGT